MNSRQTFTLKLGDLELQCSPGVWTVQDLQDAAQAFEEIQKKATDPAQALNITVASVMVVVKLILKSALPNHPNLTRQQLLALDLDTLMELPARFTEAQNAILPTRRIQ